MRNGTHPTSGLYKFCHLDILDELIALSEHFFFLMCSGCLLSTPQGNYITVCEVPHTEVPQVWRDWYIAWNTRVGATPQGNSALLSMWITFALSSWIQKLAFKILWAV